jgi:hypothetical protein
METRRQASATPVRSATLKYFKEIWADDEVTKLAKIRRHIRFARCDLCVFFRERRANLHNAGQNTRAIAELRRDEREHYKRTREQRDGYLRPPVVGSPKTPQIRQLHHRRRGPKCLPHPVLPPVGPQHAGRLQDPPVDDGRAVARARCPAVHLPTKRQAGRQRHDRVSALRTRGDGEEGWALPRRAVPPVRQHQQAVQEQVPHCLCWPAGALGGLR